MSHGYGYTQTLPWTLEGRVPSGSRNDEKEMKTDENESRRQKNTTHLEWQNNVPLTIGAEDAGQLFVQDFTFLDQELKTLIQDFDLGLARLDYSQGCFELKREEQSRATNWGLIGVID
ncbi:hypothetical protein M9H77_17772 [Catharanthus roseus]|uniref:Uncharacterized protein n=1 Tax=Catharanthus roseus TaxID=4058 RepID=A0ACC0B5J9_CATRO|nr:hypothetical protein M9H77_17772 [Catharanthus roseus]